MSDGAPGPVRRLPYAFAKRHGVAVVDMQGPRACVVHRPDVTLESLAEVRRFCARPLELTALAAEPFASALAAVYEQSPELPLGDLAGLDSDLDVAGLVTELLESEDDAPVVALVNALLTKAVAESASDIHIEPFEDALRVRLRVDGMLREVLAAPREVAPFLATRVKVMARLDVAERRRPQDGRLSFRLAGRSMDVRVSTVPSGQGERIVLRLLYNQAARLTLDRLGMDPPARAAVDDVIRRPHGIILVSGPTGAGKTTTLYAMLTAIRNATLNIMTVEDPIEYQLDGVSQTQVNPKVGLGFAESLRAVLRQDPDVVMVGEIRDPETARMVVRFSQTGHRVLSTLHTNSAVGAVPRLLDLGIEPSLLAASLSGTIAQRLLRELCVHCKRSYPASPEEATALGLDGEATTTLGASAGCRECEGTGHRGRLGVFEVVPVDEALRALILEGASEATLAAHASGRWPTLRSQARTLVLAGRVSLSEFERVVGRDAG